MPSSAASRRRGNAPQVEAAIENLENASLESDPDYNTEIGVLNKINAASVIGLRNGQETLAILQALRRDIGSCSVASSRWKVCPDAQQRLRDQ